MNQLTKKMYKFDPNTKEFLGEFSYSYFVKQDGTPLTAPADTYHTESPPPDKSQKQTAIFQDDKWKLLDDFRNTIFYDVETKKQQRLDLGEKPNPALVTSQTPPSINASWDGDKWIQELPQPLYTGRDLANFLKLEIGKSLQQKDSLERERESIRLCKKLMSFREHLLDDIEPLAVDKLDHLKAILAEDYEEFELTKKESEIVVSLISQWQLDVFDILA